MNINRVNSKVRLPCSLLGVCLALLLLVPCAWAEVVMPAGEAQTHAMAGGFALLREPDQQDPYGTDPEAPFPSFPVWFDTGASGNLISAWVAWSLGIPITGETYEDVGIGGVQTFDVSESTELLLVPSLKQPTEGDISYADQMSSYLSYGDFNLQLNRNWSAPYDIIGTPVLNNYVMRVRPNSIVHQFDHLSGYYPMLYMETALLNELPAGLPPALTIEIPLLYNNYVPPDPPISAATNPVIPRVKLADALSGMVPTEEREWLFDSGASVTIISKLVATEVGLDQNTPSVSTIQVGGIGGNLDLYGYEIDELILPSNDETQLIFTDSVVYVIDWAEETLDLPAGLQGIFGMNLINKSIDSVPDWLYLDWVLHPEYLTDSPFTEWYVDPFGPQLILVLEGLPGDVNGDGYVGQTDLATIIGNWGLSDASSWQGDLNGNGVVDGPDYSEVISYWSPPPAPPEPAPEPATLLLLACGTVALAARRRRFS
ncbi:MAG: aspartyl protease family protein [Phycisphaerae bacterium]|nr:aspartyl protease family protein [Phycisphaerae bacterium]